MPSKIRYYFNDGAKASFGAKAKQRLIEIVEAALKQHGAVIANKFNQSTSFKALCHNFKTLKEIGVLPKASCFVVWRDREHLRLHRSTYKQSAFQQKPNDAPKGEYFFERNLWHSPARAWAIPLIQEAGGLTQRANKSEKSVWRITMLHKAWGAGIHIVNGKVMAQGWGKTKKFDIGEVAGIPMPPQEMPGLQQNQHIFAEYVKKVKNHFAAPGDALIPPVIQFHP